MTSHFRGKTVVVTGAGGSIGSVLCEQLLGLRVDRLVLLSLTESGLYTINKRLLAIGSDTEIIPVLGSVANQVLVNDILRGADIVVHAAAHKHVPICEENPCEAVMNNVFGTQVLLNAAVDHRVEQFVLVSSDKAVNPQSVMGKTKRAAELLVRESARTFSGTQFATVRFGNVLDSAGSVLPLWREQIAAGGPITITDERCERYFMSIPDACGLIVSALEIVAKDGGGLFVFNMGEPVRIVELARRLIVNSGMPCEIVFTGLRPGEKISEELHVGGMTESTDNPEVLRVVEKERSVSFREMEHLGHFAARRVPQETLRILSSIVQ